MPTYMFGCAACGQQFDMHATIRERESGITPPCPRCGSPRTEQVLSAPLLVRRGSAGSGSCGYGPGGGCCGS